MSKIKRIREIARFVFWISTGLMGLGVFQGAIYVALLMFLSHEDKDLLYTGVGFVLSGFVLQWGALLTLLISDHCGERQRT